MHTKQRIQEAFLVYLILGGEVHGLGGWPKYVRELATCLIKCGCRVKILCRMGKIYTSIDNVQKNIKNIDTVDFSKKSQFYVLSQHLPNPISVLLCLINLLKDIRRENSSQKILHIHDVSGSLLIALLVNAFYKLPLVIQIHGFPLKEQLIKLRRAKSCVSSFIWLLTKAWHGIATNFMRNSNVPILVNNAEVKSFYESCGISPNKIKVISSAIDLQQHVGGLLPKTQASIHLGIDATGEGTTIGYIGGLRPEKNLIRLIKAFKCFIDGYPQAKAKLLLIGDGPIKDTLEGLVKKYDLDNHVLFLGWIPDAYRFLNAIDIFVLPSLSEGSPLSLLEAMVAGKAIVASNIPAIREKVKNRKEAILINPYDVGELKRALSLLYSNPDLRAKLGHRAKEKARLYNVNKVYGEILKVYEELVRRKTKNASLETT